MVGNDQSYVLSANIFFAVFGRCGKAAPEIQAVEYEAANIEKGRLISDVVVGKGNERSPAIYQPANEKTVFSTGRFFIAVEFKFELNRDLFLLVPLF